MTGLALEFPGGAARYPGRHEVVEAVLVRAGERIPAVVKKVPLTFRQRLGELKAERSFRTAKELIARGVPTPEPLGAEIRGGESWYVARKLEGAVQIREWFLHRDDPAFPVPSLPHSFEEIVGSLGRLARVMHEAGVFFRDFTDGNVLVTGGEDRPRLWLVDLNRVRLFEGPVSLSRRLRDLSRPGLNRPEDRHLLLQSYFGADAPPRLFEIALGLLRRRVVFWDGLKALLRPWRR